MNNNPTPTDTDQDGDPGHLLPDAAWEKVKAEAEAFDASAAKGAQPAEDEA